MTSVLRQYSRIDPRIQYFIILDDCSGWTLDVNATSSPLMEVNAFLSAFSPSNVTQGLQFKDLGRQITLYNGSVVGSPHIAKFRQVMLVNGPNIEGVSNTIVYICVWVDDDITNTWDFLPVSVARNG